MKRILLLSLGFGLLVGNLSAQSWQWYRSQISGGSLNHTQKNAVQDALEGGDYQNVTIVEYLLTQLTEFNEYEVLIGASLDVKIEVLRSFFSAMHDHKNLSEIESLLYESGVPYKDLVKMTFKQKIKLIKEFVNPSFYYPTSKYATSLNPAAAALSTHFVPSAPKSIMSGVLPSSMPAGGGAGSAFVAMPSYIPVTTGGDSGSHILQPAGFERYARYLGVSSLGSVGEYNKLIKDFKRGRVLNGDQQQELNDLILAHLLAPKPVTKETLEEVVPVDSVQDINNMAILDFLLEARFNQPKGTIDQMYPYFKIVDVKRQLLPLGLRTELYFKQPRPLGFTGYESASNAANLTDFPTEEYYKPRDQTFTRRWIEFPNPNPSMYRHLDYSAEGGSAVYLLNSSKWMPISNDYDFFKKYPIYSSGDCGDPNKITSYYWMADGSAFMLTFSSGANQLYSAIDGNDITACAKPEPITEVEAELEIDAGSGSDSDSGTAVLPAPTAEEAASAKAANVKQMMRQAKDETQAHSIARKVALLNASGKSGQDPDALKLGTIIQTLDMETYTGISDRQINALRRIVNDDYEDYSNDQNKFVAEVLGLMTQSPEALPIFDRAKIYYAIKYSGDPRFTVSPNYVTWKSFVESSDEDLQAALVGVSAAASSGGFVYNYNHVPRNEVIGAIMGRYALTSDQIEVFNRPASFLPQVGKLLRKKVAEADAFEQAKIYYAISTGLQPKPGTTSDDLSRWKVALGI